MFNIIVLIAGNNNTIDPLWHRAVLYCFITFCAIWSRNPWKARSVPVYFVKTGMMMYKNTVDVNSFWTDFSRVLSECGIDDKHAVYYLKWAQDFALSMKGVPLRERSVDDIRAFIDGLRTRGLEDWQVDQARDSIAILYRKHLEIEFSALPSQGKAPQGDSRDHVRSVAALESQYGPVFEELRAILALRHYSSSTVAAYLAWARRFLVFCDCAAVETIPPSKIGAYLTYLAQVKHVAESTQNQALNALVFLFTRVLKREPGDFSGFVRAKAPVRVPDALSLPEMVRLLAELSGVDLLITSLLYASGLRISECLSLRVQDLEFDNLNIRVFRGKGQKDRITVMDKSLADPLKAHLVTVRKLFDADVLHEPGLRWGDYYVFPDDTLRVDNSTRVVRRMHLHRNRFARVLSEAAERAQIEKNVTPHVLRHTFATHMLEMGKDIRKIQDLLGHAFVSTTMHYTHRKERSGRFWPSLLGKFRRKTED